MNRHSAARRAFSGFTLVETMVALVIGLLATFIVMQVFALSEGQKRTIMGGADAQSDAAVVLYLIERDLRQAGYGLSPNPEDFAPPYTAPKDGGVLTSGILAKCATVTAYKKDRATTTDFVYADNTFAPVVINPANFPGGDTGTDLLLVNYGAAGGMIGKGVLMAAPNGATTQSGGDVPDFVVNTSKGSRAGFMNGDLVLAVPPLAGGTNCAIAEVTGLPDGGGAVGAQPGCVTDFVATNPFINHNDVAYKSFYQGTTGCEVTNAKWNKGGADLGFPAGSQLYNLGPEGSFVSRVYAVRNGNLTVCDLTVNDCKAAVDPATVATVWVPVANGVVGLRAQYGKDTDFNGTINAWNADAPATPAARSEVAAVRLFVVVRSGQFEREDVTTAVPVWRKDATAAADVTFDDINLTGTNWQRFRYKQAQSIVPVRNLIWGQQN